MGKKIYSSLQDIFTSEGLDIDGRVVFSDLDSYPNRKVRIWQNIEVDFIKESELDFDKYVFFLAIGNPKTRESVYNKYPKTIEYATIIHPSAVISNYVKLGDGCFVGAGSIIDADVIIGKQSHLNFHSVIGHDCRIGDFFSAAQAVNIGGNCHFGNTVWFGTNSCVKQGVKICDDVVVGIGDCIVKDITEQGIYVGRPARKIR